MATVHKTIALTDQQDAWIKAQITAGRHTNDSEFMRDLSRRDQERSAELDAVRAALIDGENSGEAKSLNAAALSAACARRIAAYRLAPAAERELETELNRRLRVRMSGGVGGLADAIPRARPDR